jgi:deoxyribodipyrimidine photo-lyase
MTKAVWWIRRDMRLGDNGALQAASAVGDIAPLFVVDPMFQSAGLARQTYMYATLKSLDASMNASLVLRHGDPVTEVVSFAREIGAKSVHVAADFAPYGQRRDSAVRQACMAAGIDFVVGDSPYVINPGTVLKDDGTPLKVFTPFYKRWCGFQFSRFGDASATFADCSSLSQGYPELPEVDVEMPPIGEEATWARWESWSPTGLLTYKDDRDNPSLDGTSRLSAPLRFGVVHPRQLIASLDSSSGAEHFRRELAWREFYADVLFHQPHTMWENLQTKMNALPLDTDDRARVRFDAFCAGMTGYPIVDAGVRQMLATGWMHNRVRMIVASFLVKDLHVPWQWGAKFFMQHLVDGDIASNNHGWQWTAGTGTDAAPYFRVFNPMSQSEKFDSSGSYVRRWVPELADVTGSAVHAPWTLGLLAPADYPAPIVDHAQERLEALSRYKSVSGK